MLEIQDQRITVVTPDDCESDPRVLEARHRDEVRRWVERGVSDAAQLSRILTLPLWNVERALHYLKTGRSLPYPEAKTPPAKNNISYLGAKKETTE